jgi:hypothetical protein
MAPIKRSRRDDEIVAVDSASASLRQEGVSPSLHSRESSYFPFHLLIPIDPTTAEKGSFV